MIKNVKVPNLGDYSNLVVVEILVKQGELVKKDQPLLILESNKVTIDIPSPYYGEIKEIIINIGDNIVSGMSVFKIFVEDFKENFINNNNTISKDKFSFNDKNSDFNEKNKFKVNNFCKESFNNEKIFIASPYVRKLAREFNVNLENIKGTGNKNRTTIYDVKNFVKHDFSNFDLKNNKNINYNMNLKVKNFSYFKNEDVTISSINKKSSSFLCKSWNSVPHVTQFGNADITDLEMFRVHQKKFIDKMNIKFTMLPFVIKACVYALKKVSIFNSSLLEDNFKLVLKKFYNIGIVVSMGNNLIIPVIKNVDRKSLFEIILEFDIILKKIEKNEISSLDLTNGTFTISNLGGIGGDYFTPIVNIPEVAILGISRASWRYVFHDGEFKNRYILPLSISYDHRVINGVDCVNFMNFIIGKLSSIKIFLLD